MHTILLIEDDTELCAMLTDYLTPEGFRVTACTTGEEGLEQAVSGLYDLILLDVGLPDMNGFDLLGTLRAQSQVPVLMLTGRAEDVDRIVGLEMGADDYLPKPFVPRELQARIRSVLRRSKISSAQQSPSSRHILIDDLLLDRSARRVTQKDLPLSLTFAEYTILEMLLDAYGNTVSREEISLKALGRELMPYDRSIDVHISNLRKKLGDAQDGGERIVTVRGLGYFYNIPERWGQAHSQAPMEAPGGAA